MTDAELEDVEKAGKAADESAAFWKRAGPQLTDDPVFDHFTAARSRERALVAEVRRMRAALVLAEDGNCDGCSNRGHCPVCKGRVQYDEDEGHRPGCELAAALGNLAFSGKHRPEREEIMEARASAIRSRK